MNTSHNHLELSDSVMGSLSVLVANDFNQSNKKCIYRPPPVLPYIHNCTWTFVFVCVTRCECVRAERKSQITINVV